jgi:hypothetical protein
MRKLLIAAMVEPSDNTASSKWGETTTTRPFRGDDLEM